MHTPAGTAIHPATERDYHDMVSVWRASGLDTKPGGRDSQSSFAKQCRLFPTSHLVALDGDCIVGVVLGTHDGRKGWINRLAVLLRYQRCGVATSLVRTCEDALRAGGHRHHRSAG